MNKKIRFSVIDAMDAAVNENRQFTGIQFMYRYDGSGGFSLVKKEWPV